jgi:hypothetical protein
MHLSRRFSVFYLLAIASFNPIGLPEIKLFLNAGERNISLSTYRGTSRFEFEHDDITIVCETVD